MERLGVRTLITTNAAGALNPNYEVGDFVSWPIRSISRGAIPSPRPTRQLVESLLLHAGRVRPRGCHRPRRGGRARVRRGACLGALDPASRRRPRSACSVRGAPIRWR
ncbi:MAG: hypothetical protein ACLTMP_07165 [Eggerthella lenta]